MALLFVLLGIAVVICGLSLWIVRHREMKWESKTIVKKELDETFEEVWNEIDRR